MSIYNNLSLDKVGLILGECGGVVGEVASLEVVFNLIKSLKH